LILIAADAGDWRGTMNRYERLMQRVASGRRILIDGATGTAIEKRGVPQLDNAWNGGGALSHPDVLRAVHEDYIRAGAEIIIANTFATHRHALRDADAEDQFDALNRRGVEIAIEARDRMTAPDVLVAGGISYWSWIGNWPAAEDLRASTAEQAGIIADAGADLLILEMMVDLDRMMVSLEAARTSGLPVWIRLSCKPADSGEMMLLRGGPLADALQALAAERIPLLSIMHTEVEDIDACLDVVEAHWTGPVGVYAHSARWQGESNKFDNTISPDAYAAHAKRWMDRGVSLIGGCCGLDVDHIQALRPLF
jgi:homocysteine S-methyltransferase